MPPKKKKVPARQKKCPKRKTGQTKKTTDKKGQKMTVNVQEVDKLQKLFDGATSQDTLQEEESFSESERSSLSGSEQRGESDESIVDPFYDSNGEYSSDENYIPDDLEVSSEESGSDNDCDESHIPAKISKCNKKDTHSSSSDEETSRTITTSADIHKHYTTTCTTIKMEIEPDFDYEPPTVSTKESPDKQQGSSNQIKVTTSTPTHDPYIDIGRSVSSQDPDPINHLLEPSSVLTKNSPEQLQELPNLNVMEVETSPSTHDSHIDIERRVSSQDLDRCNNLLEPSKILSKDSHDQQQELSNQNDMEVETLEPTRDPHIHIERRLSSQDLDRILSQISVVDPLSESSINQLPESQTIEGLPEKDVSAQNDDSDEDVEVEMHEEDFVAQNDDTIQPDLVSPRIISDPSAITSNATRRHVMRSQQLPTNDAPWVDTTAPLLDFPFDDTITGPTFPCDSNSTPLDILNQFLTSELIEFIIACTNSYGNALCNSTRPHTRWSRKQKFEATNSEEIKKFIGLCLLQGQVNSCQLRKLFTYTDPLYFHPVFPLTMSGRRFEQLLRCLYVSTTLNCSGMAKLNLYIKKVITIFQSLYNPQRELALDESLLLFRGRLSFRQYMKQKKSKYGIKFYVVTSSDGYILNFKIYEGKGTWPEDIGNEPKLQKLVMTLMDKYLFKGHMLYMDNFYNSVSLSETLLNYDTHTTGTLRKDRKDNPKPLIGKNLKKGEHIWQRKENVYVSRWKDRRPVNMITTKHHPRLVVSRNRYGKIKSKPIEVVDYNRHMSGIDKSDQMMSYYSSPNKTIRWYKKVFFHILDMMVWNAYYIFNKHCDNNMSMLEFREKIIQSYIQIPERLDCLQLIMQLQNKNSNRKSRVVRDVEESTVTTAPAPAAPIEITANHWPEAIPVPPQNKRAKVFLKCRECRHNKTLKETSYRCKTCIEKPALCPGCFEAYHLRMICLS